MPRKHSPGSSGHISYNVFNYLVHFTGLQSFGSQFAAPLLLARYTQVLFTGGSRGLMAVFRLTAAVAERPQLEQIMLLQPGIDSHDTEPPAEEYPSFINWCVGQSRPCKYALLGLLHFDSHMGALHSRMVQPFQRFSWL